MLPSANSEVSDGGTPSGVRWLALLAGLLVAGLGVKSALQDYRLIHKLTHLEEYYEITPAKFLKVDVRRDSSGNEDDWHPDVLFEHFMGGKGVWGWRFSFEDEPRPKSFWEERLKNYHADNWLMVYVNPDDHKDSFVEKERDGLARIFLRGLLGIGFALAGIGLSGLTLWGWIRKLLSRF